MDATQAHLFVNHLPIVGAFFGFALVALAAFKRNEPNTVHAATLVLALSAVGGVAAYVSGEDAEHAAEERPGFDHDRVEAHEDLAVPAVGTLLFAAAVGGAVSFVGRRRVVPLAATVAWLGAAAGAAGAMTWMGLTGREVGHPDRYGVEVARD